MCRWIKTKRVRVVWSLLYSSVMFLLSEPDHVYAAQGLNLMVPTSHTACSTDLYVQLQLRDRNSTFLSLETSNQTTLNSSLEISLLSNNQKTRVAKIQIYPDLRSEVTQILLQCGYFVSGGTYLLEVDINNNNSHERLKQHLDVRWPTPKLSVTPELIGTYPEMPIDVVLSFPEVQCEIKNAINSIDIAEFWLELIYCGQDIICSNSNGTANKHILYAEQIKGFPRTKLIKLRCEFFGLAGHYIVQLRPMKPTPSFVSAISYIRADWNEKFVFNVHARSIFPCDPHTGVGVLFEYPACILDQGDKVRLFAKLRADVASLKPPTSLHYVTEQRVTRGQHSLHFDCDLFSEKYVEYCFVYVSQSISGAVADIRMDCVPTLPVSDSDVGGWGPWSEWTPCSTTCFGGTKNRYRLCDSPPPRYGAKFCEGTAVEIEQCGKNKTESLKCLYGTDLSSAEKDILDKTELNTSIGPGCRCGCTLHLGKTKPMRMIAASSQSCPGRSIWLIQADDGYEIGFNLDTFRLYCPTQYVKIRTGDSLGSNLIADFSGGTKISNKQLTSDGPQLLIEFFSDMKATIDGSCSGGFLSHSYLIKSYNETTKLTSFIKKSSLHQMDIGRTFTIVHITVIIFVSAILVITALLVTQYTLRYRKYHLTENRAETISPNYTPRTSIDSFQEQDHLSPSRALSTTTMLSEVIYLVKIRPKGQIKHSILRESMDAETMEKKRDRNNSLGSKTHDENEVYDSNKTISDLNCVENIHTEKDLEHEDHKATPTSINEDNIPVDFNYKSRTPSPNIKFWLSKDVEIGHSEESNANHFNNCDHRSPNGNVLSASTTTLTIGHFSPGSSIISTATIRSTNQKENKEKQNRKKLLTRPDSEFSLANPEELELDYYDYNVMNAGAAPGSYLGMDPAYLVWIPPLDEGNIIDDVEKEKQSPYDEIMPKYFNIDPGSNTETPDYEIEDQSSYIAESENGIKNSIIQKTIFTAMLKESPSSRRRIKINPDLTTLTEFSDSQPEKEISVVKSPSDNLNDYYLLDDIKFADDDDNNDLENTKSKKNGSRKIQS